MRRVWGVEGQEKRGGTMVGGGIGDIKEVGDDAGGRGGNGSGGRRWDGEGEVEMGMGFGESGAFDPIDYSVRSYPPSLSNILFSICSF